MGFLSGWQVVTYQVRSRLAGLPRCAVGNAMLMLCHDSRAAVGPAGQERKEVPGSQHLACTVEMVPLARRVDVAIIDEIQARRLKRGS